MKSIHNNEQVAHQKTNHVCNVSFCDQNSDLTTDPRLGKFFQGYENRVNCSK